MAIAATYISATSFSITGTDYTTECHYGRRLLCACGVDGDREVTISGSSWNSTITTVNLFAADSDDITSNLTSFKFGPGVGSVGSVSARGLKHSKMDELDYASADHTGFASENALTTTSGSLQTSIDAKPDTLLELTDTPSSYANGLYLQSTADGTEWATASGGGGVENHSELNELDYASAGHTGFASSDALTTTSGALSSEIDSDISTHNSDTTSVHGITDTSDLALKSGNVNQLNDITSAGADIEDAVTKKHDESHTINSHSDTTASGSELDELTDGSDTTLHDHDGISENSAARHTQGTDTALGTMAEDIDMDNSYQVVNLQAPAVAGEALRQTTNITEADLEQLTDGSDTTLHDHDGISENTSARHTRSHAITDTSDHTAGNWKLFASNGSGEITEITHGAGGYVLKSNSETSAPTWQIDATASGGGLSNIVEDATPQLGGNLDLNNYNIDYGAILTSSGTYEGKIMTVTVDDASAVFGSTLYCASDFNYERCDADSTTTMVCVALALESGTGSKKVLLEGQICDTSWSLSTGPVYTSLDIGDITQTVASGTGDQVQKIGYALSANTMYFRPDSTVIEIP